jgi:lysophospholipase L1-like esterase
MSRRYGRATTWTVALGGLCAVAVVAWGLVAVLAVSPPVAAPAAPVHRAVVAGAPSVTFVGDSWTEGVGATGMRGYAVLTCEQLGWECHVLGVGGSGYTRRGPNADGSTFGERIDRAVETHPDVIVVQGSLNERHSSVHELAEAARNTFTRLRAEADPRTRILVVGASHNPGTPDRRIDGINRTIAAAAERTGVPFVDPAAQDWTDPHDPRIWADSIHPDDAGHQRIADHLARLLLAIQRQ